MKNKQNEINTRGNQQQITGCKIKDEQFGRQSNGMHSS